MDNPGAAQSDESLILRAKEGDREAFEIFYNRHKRKIMNYVYRMLGSRESAEEITQDVFVKVYINLKRYVSQGKALNWVYTIAGNLCKNFLRNRRYQPDLVLDKRLSETGTKTLGDIIETEIENPSEEAIDKEKAALIQEHIGRIPVKYREVLILCDIQGYSYEEAGRILKCGTGTIGSRLCRARSILANSLKEKMRP